MRRQSEHFADYAGRARPADPRGARLSRLHEPRRDPRPHRRARDAAAGAGRAIPTACRSIPALDKALSRAERRRRIAAGEPFAWRLDIGRGARRGSADRSSWTEFDRRGHGGRRGRSRREPQRLGRRRAGAQGRCPTSYHLSVVVDDALQGVHTSCAAATSSGDRRPAPAAGTARAARALLFPPPADRRAGRAQAVQEPARHRPGRAAAAGRHAWRGSSAGSALEERAQRRGQPGLDQRQQGQRDE